MYDVLCDGDDERGQRGEIDERTLAIEFGRKGDKNKR